jgi:hypothetical protein
MRLAGIVQIPESKSIYLHRAPHASPARTAVRIVKRSASADIVSIFANITMKAGISEYGIAAKCSTGFNLRRLGKRLASLRHDAGFTPSRINRVCEASLTKIGTRVAVSWPNSACSILDAALDRFFANGGRLHLGQCFVKEKAQIFGIYDAVKVTCHVDQNERQPGDAGNRRDRRGDAQHYGCRGKSFSQLSRMGQ